IKYGLLADAPVPDPMTAKDRRARAKITAQHRTSPSPIMARTKKEKEFTAIVKRTAIWERVITVNAANQTEAKKKASTEANSQTYELRDAVVHDEIRNIRPSR